MEQTELYIAVMAGLVLSAFLIVSEIAALRKQATRLKNHWKQCYISARFSRIFMELCGVAAFFLVQPVLVALLVVMALSDFNPKFSSQTISQLQHQVHPGRQEVDR